MKHPTNALFKSLTKRQISTLQFQLTQIAKWEINTPVSEYATLSGIDAGSTTDPFYNGLILTNQNNNLSQSIDFLTNMNKYASNMKIIVNEMIKTLTALLSLTSNDEVQLNILLQTYVNLVTQFNTLIQMCSPTGDHYLLNAVQPDMTSLLFDSKNSIPLNQYTLYMYYNCGSQYVPYYPELVPPKVVFTVPYQSVVVFDNQLNLTMVQDNEAIPIDCYTYHYASTADGAAAIWEDNATYNFVQNPKIADAQIVNTLYEPNIYTQFMIRAYNEFTNGNPIPGEYYTNEAINTSTLYDPLTFPTSITVGAFRQSTPASSASSNTEKVFGSYYLTYYIYKGQYYYYQWDKTTQTTFLKIDANGVPQITAYNPGKYVLLDNATITIQDADGNIGVLEEANTNLGYYWRIRTGSSSSYTYSLAAYQLDSQIVINNQTYYLINGKYYIIDLDYTPSIQPETQSNDPSTPGVLYESFPAINFYVSFKSQAQFEFPTSMPVGSINPVATTEIQLYSNWYYDQANYLPTQLYYVYNGKLYVFNGTNYYKDFSITLTEYNTPIYLNTLLIPTSVTYSEDLQNQLASNKKLLNFIDTKLTYVNINNPFLANLIEINNVQIANYTKQINELKETTMGKIQINIEDLCLSIELLTSHPCC
jgi:hypothetical protein